MSDALAKELEIMRSRRHLVIGAAITALALASAAYMADNTVSATGAGEGNTTVTYHTVSGTTYVTQSPTFAAH